MTVVETLWSAGANLDAVNVRGITPLQRAVLNQWLDTAKILLKHGADCNVRDEDGDTALTAALQSDQEDMVKLLLGPGNLVDPDVLNGGGMTPLMLALRSPQKFLPLLIETKPDVRLCSADGINVLHKAAAGNGGRDSECVLPLFQYGKDYLNIHDMEGLTPLHHAAKRGRKDIMMSLLELEADMASKDGQGRSPMHHAVWAMRSSPEDFSEAFAEYLQPHETNEVHVPDADGWYPLHWAAKGDCLRDAELLLGNCESVNERLSMILHKGHRGWNTLAIAEFHGALHVHRHLKSLTIVQSTNSEESDMDSHTKEGVLVSSVKPDEIKEVRKGNAHTYVVCDDCSMVR